MLFQTILNSRDADFARHLSALRYYDAAIDAAIEIRVKDIVAAVKARGASAVLSYSRQFDGIDAHSLADLCIPRQACEEALSQLSPDIAHALEAAAARIRRFHQAQLAQHHGFSYQDEAGNRLGEVLLPLEKVGIYVPGGRAAYPSSVLMNAIPARVAGVKKIIMTVPTPGGERNPYVLAAAALAGVDEVWSVGGAQAVAALAFGCADGSAAISAVDKITGPGNAYVAAAKRLVFGSVGIDMIAGPSEVLVITDGSVDPDWLVLDLFAQAEHDELAQAILICPVRAYLETVAKTVDALLPAQPRRDIIKASLQNRGALIYCRDLVEACDIANVIAPEHLEIATAVPGDLFPLIKNAGAVFLGRHACEAMGDYCAGPNHVLPTAGSARFSSPLGVPDFQKRMSLIEVGAIGAQTLAPIAATLGRAEGLHAHAQSAERRLS